MRLRITLVAIVLLLAGAIVLAQGPIKDAGAGIPLPKVPDLPKDTIKGKPLSVDVDVVSFDLVVIDKNQSLIKGLEKRDFRVFDDNVEQTITGFASTETPLTCVIMFEFSKFSVYASDSYFFAPMIGFGNSLRDDDWAALVKFDLHTEILSDFTKNKNQLFSPINDLRFATYSESVLFDALYE